MATISIQHEPQFQTVHATSNALHWLQRFLLWIEGQERNRILWTGIAITTQGSILLPAAMLTILMSGLNFYFLIIPIAAIFSTLLVNLAALPAKITIPVYFLGLGADVAITASAFIAMT